MKNAECRMKKECHSSIDGFASGGKNSAFCILHSTFSSAFTLIEMVTVIALIVITSGITIHYLVSAGRLYTLMLAQKQADSEVMDAVSRMRREVRLHVQTLTANSNAWAFSNTCNAINTTFSCAGADLNLNNNRLAAGIERFALSYYDATNSLLSPLPLSTAACARISRVALDFKATNSLTASELKINFFLQENLLK